MIAVVVDPWHTFANTLNEAFLRAPESGSGGTGGVRTPGRSLLPSLVPSFGVDDLNLPKQRKERDLAAPEARRLDAFVASVQKAKNPRKVGGPGTAAILDGDAYGSSSTEYGHPPDPPGPFNDFFVDGERFFRVTPHKDAEQQKGRLWPVESPCERCQHAGHRRWLISTPRSRVREIPR